MGPKFDLRVSIHPNPENIFMAVFIGLAYSTLNSAKLSCSSEVTNGKQGWVKILIKPNITTLFDPDQTF